MKTTIYLPEPLMAELERLADREQRNVDDLVMELVQTGMERRRASEVPVASKEAGEQWLAEWLQLGAETLRDAPSSPTGTDILAESRNRLEPDDRC